jgi:hypothetical protein
VGIEVWPPSDGQPNDIDEEILGFLHLVGADIDVVEFLDRHRNSPGQPVLLMVEL